MSRLLARLAVVGLAGSALSLGFVSAAGAHVTVRSVDAVQGGYAELSFEVPTESGTASTVKPGEYEVFRVVAGPLPKTAQLVFKAVQTYDDNTVVRWIDQPAAGSSAPEHPAPVLTLPAGSGVAGMSHIMPAAAASASGAPPMAWWAMAVTGIAVLAALGVIVIALRTVRRRGGEHAPA